MRQDYYEYIRLTHEDQLKFALQQKELKILDPDNPTLRKRALLYLSDSLLNLGQRIRPAEFEVQVHGHGAQSHESTLEITTKGC